MINKSYQVRLISYDSRIYAETQKPFPSAPLLLCCLNDKSLTGHDIIRFLGKEIGYSPT